jgi:hypothetical protein
MFDARIHTVWMFLALGLLVHSLRMVDQEIHQIREYGAEGGDIPDAGCKVLTSSGRTLICTARDRP